MAFESAKQVLSERRDELVARLPKVGSEEERLEIVAVKHELDQAIACLDLCARFGISPRSEVAVLPDKRTRTHLSEFRIVEDHETDRRQYWMELCDDHGPLRPLPGDLLIRRKRSAGRCRLYLLVTSQAMNATAQAA